MVEITLNHLAKKLSGEEGGAKNKQRVIDLAANGLESNPNSTIDERAQWYKKMVILQK